ncbi:hypothetical protein LTR56_000332 [Elasticomyces elasticus]|nr:hypothetical protein LTR56_000332 [Elasticomyces elasticus]KAK3666973.1 hypothetical protein LTR22_002198 [Elasticomyces elasticus]KAK4933324.1 hypothetical protein LTR49_000318 [Elasticomyces elasticus]
MADHHCTVLKAEIEAVIAEYTKSDSGKPPYTTAHLVVMAAVCNHENDVSKASVLRWASSTFPYYTREAIEGYITSQERWHMSFGAPRGVAPGITKAINTYEMPLQTILQDPANPGAYPRITLRVLPAPARIFLRSLLEPTRPGVFAFLDLPSEMRNRIYGLLLTFSKDGLYVSVPSMMALQCREAESYDASIKIHPGDDKWNYQRADAPPLREILAILQTCKQIYKEAMPWFYGGNRFRLKCPWGLTTSALSLAPSRMEHLSDLLEVRFKGGDDEWLNMEANAREYMGITGADSLTRIEQIPMFPSLALVAARARELAITGPCPQIEEYLKGEVARLKQMACHTSSEVVEGTIAFVETELRGE